MKHLWIISLLLFVFVAHQSVVSAGAREQQNTYDNLNWPAFWQSMFNAVCMLGKIWELFSGKFFGLTAA
uniref:Uncharacterized protein n=1 Tax=Trichobilharzia regenti TaxID=157069 RepID=A0AA85IX66_TRIRE|nr:unnamed protein product [Trichobilharzia regenti]